MTDLPDWFPLDVYHQDLSYSDWLIELSKRSMLNQVTHFYSSKIDAFNDLILRESSSTLFAEDDSPTASLVDTYLTKSVVRSIYEIDKYKEQNSNLNDNYCVTESTFVITLDVSATDAEIANDIKEFVKAKRSELQSIKSKDIDQRIYSWKKDQLLAVFDLYHWFKFSNKNLTQEKMGEAIWPDDKEGDVKQRFKDSLNKAKKLILNGDHEASHSLLRRLSQAKR